MSEVEILKKALETQYKREEDLFLKIKRLETDLKTHKHYLEQANKRIAELEGAQLRTPTMAERHKNATNYELMELCADSTAWKSSEWLDNHTRRITFHDGSSALISCTYTHKCIVEDPNDL